jgi:predicted site-specific integrase-resolvase
MTIQSKHPGYSVGEFASKVGRCRATLQRWDRLGQLTAYRTPGGHRFYTDEQLAEIMGRPAAPAAPRRMVIYCRVSGAAQMPDLKHQVQALEQFCIARGVAADEVLQDIGSGLTQAQAFSRLARRHHPRRSGRSAGRGTRTAWCVSASSGSNTCAPAMTRN